MVSVFPSPQAICHWVTATVPEFRASVKTSPSSIVGGPLMAGSSPPVTVTVNVLSTNAPLGSVARRVIWPVPNVSAAKVRVSLP